MSPVRSAATPAKSVGTPAKKSEQPKTPGVMTPKGKLGDPSPLQTRSARKKKTVECATPKAATEDVEPSTTGNLGDPSPLQTRSARKRKSMLVQAVTTPKMATPAKTVEIATPKSAGKKVQKEIPKQKTPVVKKAPKTNDSDEDDLDSDDLDSDDVDTNESDDEDAETRPKKEVKKGLKTLPAVEKKDDKKIQVADATLAKAAQTPLPKSPKIKVESQPQDADADLAEAAQTPLPKSPDAIKPEPTTSGTPKMSGKNDNAKSPGTGKKGKDNEAKVGTPVIVKKEKEPSPAKNPQATPKGASKPQKTPVREVVFTPKTQTTVVQTGDSAPTKTPVKEGAKSANTITPKNLAKAAAKNDASSTKTPTKTETPVSKTPAPTTPKTGTNVVKTPSKGSAKKAGESTETPIATPGKEESAAVPATEPSGKSPGKRTKGPKDSAKKIKLAESEESKTEAAKSPETKPDEKETKKMNEEDSATEKATKPSEDKENTSGTTDSDAAKSPQLNMKRLAQEGFSEEKLETFRQDLIAAGKDEQEVQQSVEKLRRMMLKTLSNLKCKQCSQRGHRKADCTQPPRVPRCFKCGAVEHKSNDCSIKEDVYPFAYCHICKANGHPTKKCPDKKPKLREVVKKSPKCYKCGETGHLITECSAQVEGLPFARCKACHKIGHVIKECPVVVERRQKRKANGVAAQNQEKAAVKTESASATEAENVDPSENKKPKNKKAKKRPSDDNEVESTAQEGVPVKKNKKEKVAQSQPDIPESKPKGPLKPVAKKGLTKTEENKDAAEAEKPIAKKKKNVLVAVNKTEKQKIDDAEKKVDKEPSVKAETGLGIGLKKKKKTKGIKQEV